MRSSPPALTFPSPSHHLPITCRAFNEAYLPWLNDLAPTRLEAEFATLHSYLHLLGGGAGADGGMAPPAVKGLMAAYVRAIVKKHSR